SLEDLLTEFIDASIPGSEAQALLASLAAERQAARDNWARIEGMLQRGEDATDAILLGLLPHTGSAANRARGAWWSHAPAVQADVRKWFEGAGWVKPENWPAAALAVHAFTADCLARPDDVAGAAARFAASGHAKGFKAGLLTPVLFALDPDHFPLVNGKVRD